MSAYPHAAIHEDRVGGHVAKAVVRYVPTWPLPPAARAKKPWACTFHDEPGGPKHFVAFGGQEGMEAVVDAYLGPLVPASDREAR